MSLGKHPPIPVLLLLFLASSCSFVPQQDTTVDYYTLEYPSPRHEGLTPLDQTLRVLRFTAEPPYDGTQIIYRDLAFRRMGYHYHRWRSNPGDLVTHFIARDLKETGLFRAVLLYDSKLTATYVLEGSVNEFYERDEEDAWSAVLGVTATLSNPREPNIENRILFQRTYRDAEPCKEKNPASLAEAMSRAMARISEKILLDIYRSLKE